MNRHSRLLWVRLSALLGLLACTLLAACDRSPDNAKADHKVLCDPETGEAYIVKPGLGDTAFVRPAPNATALCKKA